jgi:ribose 5-phosphate isomerase B
MPGKHVVTDAEIRAAARRGATFIKVPPGSIVTPLALDTARESGIAIQFGQPDAGRVPEDPSLLAPRSDVIAVGSDHGGYALKEELKTHLSGSGRTLVDVGTDSPQSCDYPDFAYAVARMVAGGRAGTGIMIDGAGIGSSMVCNKVPGIRAASAYNEFTAWNARAHNDANVLTLGSRTLGIEVVKRIVDAFLATEFEGGRHARRVNKIRDVERTYTDG